MGLVLLLIGLIACIAPIAVVVLIVTAIVKRNKEEKNNFDETVRNIYVYIILIITLITIITGVIATFRMGLDIILPEKSIVENSYSDEQIERNEMIVEFATTLSLLIVAIPIFVYHNNLAKKARENNVTKIMEEEQNN